MSKRREILEAVATQLALISTDSGYNTDPDSIKYGIRSIDERFSTPAIDYYLNDEEAPEYEPDNQALGELRLVVVGYRRQGKDEDDLVIEDLAEDIVTAMHTDHTLGGYSIDCMMIGRSTDPFLEDGLPRVCALEFLIKYVDDYSTF